MRHHPLAVPTGRQPDEHMRSLPKVPHLASLGVKAMEYDSECRRPCQAAAQFSTRSGCSCTRVLIGAMSVGASRTFEKEHVAWCAKSCEVRCRHVLSPCQGGRDSSGSCMTPHAVQRSVRSLAAGTAAQRPVRMMLTDVSQAMGRLVTLSAMTTAATTMVALRHASRHRHNHHHTWRLGQWSHDSVLTGNVQQFSCVQEQPRCWMGPSGRPQPTSVCRCWCAGYHQLTRFCHFQIRTR
jgi:hypothetical protein